MRVELLWFAGCPHHEIARAMVIDAVWRLAPAADVRDIDATDPAVAERHRFPGSPTVRVDERDIDPGFRDSGDYTPRCRLYRTSGGLRGLPERSWLEAAVRASLRRTRRHGAD